MFKMWIRGKGDNCMIEELSISDKLRLLGLAKEIRAVIFMHKQDEINEEKGDVSIGGYVDEVIEIAEKMAEWIMKDGKVKEKEEQEIVTIVVRDGKRKTVDAREQLKMLGFRWNAKEKAWIMKTSKKEAEELVFADELKDLHISLDKELGK